MSTADYRILSGLSGVLEADYTDAEEEWAGSPFGWIKKRPSRQIGAIGEKLVAGWLAARGFSVARSPDSDADRLIEGQRAEIKFSTLWANGGYKFQQLRDQNYDFAICLGVSPHSAHCWVIEKPRLMAMRRQGLIPAQHGGRDGIDTAWLSLNPAALPDWIAPYGGSLAQAVARVSALTGYHPPPSSEGD